MKERFNTMIKEYQEFTRTTAQYPKDQAIIYCTLGLMNEAGEVGGKVKKVIRDHENNFNDPEQIAKIIDELSDLFWYSFRLADELGVSVEDVLSHNMVKLQDRLNRGVIKGSGDSR